MPHNVARRLDVGVAHFKRSLILGNLVILGVIVLTAWLAADARQRAQEPRARRTAAGLAQTLRLG